MTPQRLSASFLGVILFCAGAEPVRAADALPTGTEIYSHALRAWTAQPETPFVAYEVTATLTRHGRVREESERVLVRTSDRTAIIQSGKKITFGRPRFVPNVTFRLVRRGVASVDSTLEPPEPEPPDAPLTIGRVVTQSSRYKVTLLGAETYRGHDVYHLALEPTFDPKQNQVRAMWVDAKTFVTWRVAVEAPYAVGPAHGTFLLDAEFAPVATAMLLDSVNTSGALRFGFVAMGGDAQVRFTNISLPVTPPAYCFEPAGFNAHESECRAHLHAP